jgi:acetyl esterase/lipase
VRTARAYAGSDTRHPYVSPILGDLRGLPPMLIHATSSEILLRDIERFAERARAAGVAVCYRRLDRSWHVAHLHAGLVSAATAAVAEAGTFLKDHTEQRDA